MRLRPIAPVAVLLLILGGCSSGGSDGDPATLDDISAAPAILGSELVGRWRLSGYTLDDGISNTVPNDSEIGIEIRSTGTLGLNLCLDYTVSYNVSDAVLTTADAVFSDQGCTPLPDAEAEQRNELLSNALLNTQTMVAVSDDDVLTVTTGTNEVLVFERFSGAPATADALAGSEWKLDAVRTDDGAMRPLYGELGRARFGRSNGYFRLAFPCEGRAGDWSLSGTVLTIDGGPIDVTGATCSPTDAVSAPVLQVIDSAIASVALRVDLDDDSLVLTLPTNERLFFSGRKITANETHPLVRLLEAGDVAST